jgi:hypothetical protein
LATHPSPPSSTSWWPKPGTSWPQPRPRAPGRNYATDWRAFLSWCAAHGFESLPADADVVALYLTDYARDHKASTVVRRAVGIAKGHRRAGYLSPTEIESVRLVLAGIRRTKGMAPTQKSPLLTADVLALLSTCRPRLGDLDDRPGGMAILLRRSKVDQEARGRHKVLVYGSVSLSCPVTAVRAWMARTAIASGPLFRPVDRHGRFGPAGSRVKAWPPSSNAPPGL